jgi:hypothetical protein
LLSDDIGALALQFSLVGDAVSRLSQTDAPPPRRHVVKDP